MRSRKRARGDGSRQERPPGATIGGEAAHRGWQYAGLWPRSLAFAVDYLVIAAWLALVTAAGAVVNRVAPTITATLFSRPLSGQVAAFLLVTLPVTLYFALLEASPWQASWGKRKLHLRVTTVGGTRLSRARALTRTALKFVPWELAHTCVWQIARVPDQAPSSAVLAGLALVGALVAANVASPLADRRRRALYDRLAGTVVVYAHVTS